MGGVGVVGGGAREQRGSNIPFLSWRCQGGGQRGGIWGGTRLSAGATSLVWMGGRGGGVGVGEGGGQGGGGTGLTGGAERAVCTEHVGATQNRTTGLIWLVTRGVGGGVRGVGQAGGQGGRWGVRVHWLHFRDQQFGGVGGVAGDEGGWGRRGGGGPGRRRGGDGGGAVWT